MPRNTRQIGKDILKNPAAAVLATYSPDSSKNSRMKLASFPRSGFLKPHLKKLEKELQTIG